MYRRHPFLTMALLVMPLVVLLAWSAGRLGLSTGVTVALLFLLAVATGPFATRDPEPRRERQRRRP